MAILFNVFLFLAIYFLLFERNNPRPSVVVCRRLRNQFFNVGGLKVAARLKKVQDKRGKYYLSRIESAALELEAASFLVPKQLLKSSPFEDNPRGH